MAISDELRKLVDPNNECCCEHCLSNKCKEWALANGFAISSGIPKPFYKKRIIGAEIFKLTDFRNAIFICYQESEYDAIIEACEYILKEHPCNQLT